MEGPPDWLRVGLTATCTLTASAPITAPSVPATLVKTRNGDFHLAFDGVYRKVDGTLVDGYLMLFDESLAGRTVDLFGAFPERENKDMQQTLPGFRATRNSAAVRIVNRRGIGNSI